MSNVVRLLLAEDNPGDAEMVKRLLSKATHSQYQVEWTDTLDGAALTFPQIVVPHRQPITPNGPASSPSRSRCFGRGPLPTPNVHRDPATPEPSRRTLNPANHAIGPIRTPRRSACARRCRSGKAADAATKIRRRQTTLRYTPVHAQMVQLAPPGYVHEVDQPGHNSLLLLNN